MGGCSECSSWWGPIECCLQGVRVASCARVSIARFLPWPLLHMGRFCIGQHTKNVKKKCSYFLVCSPQAVAKHPLVTNSFRFHLLRKHFMYYITTIFEKCPPFRPTYWSSCPCQPKYNCQPKHSSVLKANELALVGLPVDFSLPTNT